MRLVGRLLVLAVLAVSGACSRGRAGPSERPAAVLVSPEARSDAPVWVAGGDAFADPAQWDEVLGVNLMGVIHGVQAFVPGMVEG